MLKNREQFATICLVGFIVLWAISYVSLDHTDSLKYSDICKAVPTVIIGALAALIAWRQKEIAEDKHRLELFEKRFETYELFLDMALTCQKLSSDRGPYEDSTKTTNEREKNAKYMKFVRDNERKMISLKEGSIFLFGSDVKSILDDAVVTILSKAELVEALNEIRITDIDTTNFIDEFSGKHEEKKGYQKGIILYDKLLKEFYQKKLPEIMGPYLKMTPYLSKD